MADAVAAIRHRRGVARPAGHGERRVRSSPRERWWTSTGWPGGWTSRTCSPAPHSPNRYLEDARALRAALRAMALATVHDRPIAPDQVIVLNDHLAADRPLTWPLSAP